MGDLVGLSLPRVAATPSARGRPGPRDRVGPEAHRARYQRAVTISIAGTVRALPAAAVLALLRTAQESLVNAAKYAGGGPARVGVSFDACATTLTVASPLSGGQPAAGLAEDDGKGSTSTADGGYGLVGMRERLLLLGGTVTAGPRDGGWIVTAQVPV